MKAMIASKRTPVLTLLVLAFHLLPAAIQTRPSSAVAQDGSESGEPKVTLETLFPIHRSAAEEYTLRAGDKSSEPLKLVPTPITQWTNIRRAGGQLGHVFVWMDGEEPAAIAALFSFPWRGDLMQRRVVHELHALSPEKLSVQRSYPGTLWQPTAGLKRQPLPGVKANASTQPRFKIVARQVMRRLSGYCVDREGERWELRVLPTPLLVYRIDRPSERGFGAVIGMMGDVGSDLESGCVIEATTPEGSKKTQWAFAPIRMTDMETHLSFDKQLIWESVRTAADTAFHDADKVYFRFQDRTIPFTAAEK